MSDKLTIEFNPDCMQMRDVKTCAQILRDLIKRREMLQSACAGDVDMIAGSLLNSFDTMTQNVEAS